MGLIPPKLGINCRPYEPGFSPRYSSLVSADVECEPIDPGPDSVKFHLFTNQRDLDVFMRRQVNELVDDGAACASGDFPYASPWVDAHGLVLGQLQCGDYVGRSKLLWSYEDLLVVASAGSPPSKAEVLNAWWQRHVRFDGRNPGAGPRRHLLALLPASFGKCRPMPLIMPMALAGVLCRPGEGITSAGAALFPSRELLSDYIEQQANLPGIDSDSCGDSPFSYMSYGWPPTYRPILGHLLCRPNFGAEWFEWTADRPLIYAFASRDDNDFVELYEQWAQSLSWIKHLRPQGDKPPEA